jgi:hypothetical protein
VPTTITPREPGNGSRGMPWIKRYGALARFQARTGSMPHEIASPVGKTQIDESRLAGWLRYQRRREERKVLPEWQRELLEQVPGFSWDLLGDQWDHWWGLLQVFLAREHRIPKYRSSCTAERNLAAWVHKQRHLFRRGELRAERVSALRALSFKIV